jgi:hypothetical protein
VTRGANADDALAAAERNDDDALDADDALAAVGRAGFSVLGFVRATKQSTVRLQPVKQLFGFSKQNGLSVGATRTVVFELSPAARALVDEKGSRLLVPGTFEVAVDNLVVEVTVTGAVPWPLFSAGRAQASLVVRSKTDASK